MEKLSISLCWHRCVLKFSSEDRLNTMRQVEMTLESIQAAKEFLVM